MAEIQATYGIVGLGAMGAGLARNLLDRGVRVAVCDTDPAKTAAMAKVGAITVGTLPDLVYRLASPRIVWLMVPAGAPVDSVLFGESGLTRTLSPGDVVIDGGNSFYKDSVRRGQALADKGIHYLDSGTSGGVDGAREGLCLMVGGDRQAFELAEPLFQLIASRDGYSHVGPIGAGHYVKMVHNAIEYGMLEAIGEGFEMLAEGPYDIDMKQIAHLWNQGSVIRSWLMELSERAFAEDPRLEQVSGKIGGGDTGSWAIQEAWANGIPLPAIALSYMMRLRSRQDTTMSGKVIAALRWQFGRHTTTPEK